MLESFESQSHSGTVLAQSYLIFVPLRSYHFHCIHASVTHDALALILKGECTSQFFNYWEVKMIQPVDSSRALFASHQMLFIFCTLSTTGNKVGMIRHERKSQVGLVIMSTVPCGDQMDQMDSAQMIFEKAFKAKRERMNA